MATNGGLYQMGFECVVDVFFVFPVFRAKILPNPCGRKFMYNMHGPKDLSESQLTACLEIGL